MMYHLEESPLLTRRADLLDDFSSSLIVVTLLQQAGEIDDGDHILSVFQDGSGADSLVDRHDVLSWDVKYATVHELLDAYWWT